MRGYLLSISISNNISENLAYIMKAIVIIPIVRHMKKFYYPLFILCYIISIPVVIVIRIINPLIHIRF